MRRSPWIWKMPRRLWARVRPPARVPNLTHARRPSVPGRACSDFSDKPFTARVTLPPDARPDELTLLLRLGRTEGRAFRTAPEREFPVPCPSRRFLLCPPADPVPGGALPDGPASRAVPARNVPTRGLLRRGSAHETPTIRGAICALEFSFSAVEAFRKVRHSFDARSRGDRAQTRTPATGSHSCTLRTSSSSRPDTERQRSIYFKATWNAAVKAPALHGLARLNLRWESTSTRGPLPRRHSAQNPRDHSVRV